MSDLDVSSRFANKFAYDSLIGLGEEHFYILLKFGLRSERLV